MTYYSILIWNDTGRMGVKWERAVYKWAGTANCKKKLAIIFKSVCTKMNLVLYSINIIIYKVHILMHFIQQGHYSIQPPRKYLWVMNGIYERHIIFYTNNVSMICSHSLNWYRLKLFFSHIWSSVNYNTPETSIRVYMQKYLKYR